MLFSATIPSQIRKLAHDLLRNPVGVDIKPETRNLLMIKQQVYLVEKNDKAGLLVATDVASRGIDVKDITHVINFDMPDGADTYTHRIGRTGRAGAEGTALSFCSREEQGLLKEIQRFSKENISVVRSSNVGRPRAD